jgi:hypothetical protein
MGDTGFQPQIGLLPLWDALYATSDADVRAWKGVQVNAKAVNSYPIVFEDSTTHLPPKPTDRPTWTVDGNNGGGETSVGTAGGLTYDVAHHGSAGYLAYIITGEYFHYETLENLAAMCYLMNSSSHGSGVNRDIQGIVQDRGQAWCIRTLGQFTAVAPSSDGVANDYRTLLANGLSSLATLAQNPSITPTGFILSYEVTSQAFSPLIGVNAPWEEDFFSSVLGMGSDIEALSNLTNWNIVRDHSYIAVVGRTGPNGALNYCFTEAATHHFFVSPNSNPPTGGWYQTWGAIWTANFGGTNTACANTLHGTSGADPANASTGYWGNLMPAIAYAKDHAATGASASWSRLTGATNWSTVLNSGFGDTPIFGIVPR